jgi:hypothetical protein
MDPSLLSAGSSIFGSALNYRSARKDRSLSKDMAKNRLTYAVADAKRAGLSPLAAIGAPPWSPPVTGSGPGDALLAASDSIRQSQLNSESKARVRLLDAQTADTVTRMKIASDLARLKITASHTKDTGLDIGIPKEELIYTPGSGRFRTGFSTKQEDVEDQYGGIVGELYGIGRFANDSVDNLGRAVREYLRKNLNPARRNPSSRKQRSRRSRNSNRYR